MVDATAESDARHLTAASTLERWHRPLLVAIAALAAALAAWARWGHSLGVDEPFTVLSAHLPFGQLLGDIWMHDNTPVTYLVLKPWAAVAGSSEIALRLPFLLAYGFAVAVTGVTARSVGGTPAGLFAALMVATSGRLGLLHAATIRPYALLCAVSAVSTWMLLRGDRASRFASVPFGAVQLLGLFVHPTYAFVVAGITITALLVETRQRGIAIAGACVASLLVYLVAWGVVLKGTYQLPATAWMSPPRADDLWQAYLFVWGNRTGFVLLGALIALICVATRERRRALREDVRLRIAIGMAVLTLLLPFVLSFAKPVFLFSRTPILALPPLAVAIAAVLSRLGNPALLAALSLTFLAGAAQYVAGSRRAGDPSPTRDSLASVLVEARCGDLLVTGGLAYMPVTYYLQQLNAPECLTLSPFPASMRAHPGWLDESEFEARRFDYAREFRATIDPARLPPGARVYVFGKRRGIGAPVYSAMTESIGDGLELDRELDRRGAFFDVIRVYRVPAQSAPAGDPRPPRP